MVRDVYAARITTWYTYSRTGGRGLYGVESVIYCVCPRVASYELFGFRSLVYSCTFVILHNIYRAKGLKLNALSTLNPNTKSSAVIKL